MNPVELKIKSKALQAEARIIRGEELKLKKRTRNFAEKQKARAAAAMNFRREMIEHHRRTVVRQAAHDTFVARSFLAGRPYSDHQPKENSPTKTNWDNVTRMIQKYGGVNREFISGIIKGWAEDTNQKEVE